MSTNTKGKIIRALENDKFKWRTIDGIATEVKEPKTLVVETIKDLSRQGVVMRSSRPSTTGEALFTTRKHYEQTTPITARLLAAFKNRAG
jgi:predicted transcriptional regulator